MIPAEEITISRVAAGMAQRDPSPQVQATGRHIARLLAERELLVTVKAEASWLVGHVIGLAENNPNMVEALDAVEDFK